LATTDEQMYKLFSISTISHFHCSVFNSLTKHNQSANLYHGCQETVTNSNIRRYYDFKVEGQITKECYHNTILPTIYTINTQSCPAYKVSVLRLWWGRKYRSLSLT
jgi:hypothetical protein